jgi:hypothetical protein
MSENRLELKIIHLPAEEEAHSRSIGLVPDLCQGETG